MPPVMDSGPSGLFVPVSKSDTVPIGTPRGIWVGTAGDLSVRAAGDAADTVFKNVPNGTLLPISPQFVRAATTAADIVALF